MSTTSTSNKKQVSNKYQYLKGFGNEHSTEAIKGSLPELGNTPMKCPHGLVAEQINGTSFTAPRDSNQRTWWYRIRPSVAGQNKWVRLDQAQYAATLEPNVTTPEQIRWKPLPLASSPTTFVEGLVCYAGAGDPAARGGLRIYVYSCNKSMTTSNQAFSSSDGDMLILPQQGTLDITTENGKLEVPSGFLCVIPRGIRFAVDVSETCRGYICEVFDSHFILPPLGVIGANGLSNPRDFEYPVAAYEDKDDKEYTCFTKFCGEMWSYTQPASPFDVVAWHGNYSPYRYNLADYCTINTVSYDHLDPSIFCVLTAQTAVFGTACCDFVIFPPRWMVAKNTFRPPYYHRNAMSEFMGNIRGHYEAKEEGFLPGGASLHSHMQAHGPDVECFKSASNGTDEPRQAPEDNLAFMFESFYTLKLTKFAAENLRDPQYMEKAWGNFPKQFKKPEGQ